MTLRYVAIVGYDDMQSLDAVGPLEVFARTTRWLEEHPSASRVAGYDVELVATKKGAITASSGLSFMATRALADVRGPDTLLIAGGRGAPRAATDKGLLVHLRRLEKRTRRFGSVCTGAFILGAAGLLKGCRVTTHWGYTEALARACPDSLVERDAIFVKDGHLYTSAGVMAGMDLALALVEEDLGRDVAVAIARELVVSARRPSGQTQLSVQLGAEAEERRLRAIQHWMTLHPDADLSVEACAKRCGMSVRNFSRMFVRDVGTTPAVWIERMRVEIARGRLEETDRGVVGIASDCGFGSPETMRRAFVRRMGISPSVYRARFEPHHAAKVKAAS